jgi:hypothetical protein
MSTLSQTKVGGDRVVELRDGELQQGVPSTAVMLKTCLR